MLNRTICIFALFSLFGCTTGCSPSVESSSTHKRESSAIKKSKSTRLGGKADSIASGHDVESGFLLLDRGKDALSWRMILADAAEKSIDAQYFLWKDDDAGKVMIQRLLAAAERGVRVRVMVDDSMTESDPGYLAVFGAHPNVELRIYKPFGPKHKSMVMRWADYVSDLKILNRRMHNKLFVVDGSLAIIGGRNIANEYFDYPGPFSFRSRDLLALGPVVDSTGTAFDRYWNSDWTVPIENIVPAMPNEDEARRQWKLLEEFATDSTHYPPGFYADSREFDLEFTELEKNLLWGKARLLVDAVPDRNGVPQTADELDRTGETLQRITEQSKTEIHIQSAYLILLQGGFEALADAHNRGVSVKLSTNSMASNNHLTAFVGYGKQRKKLLGTGAHLFEMRPDAKSQRQLFNKAQLEKYKPVFGLHAKTMVFDRMTTFVGSFNLDPRSVNLNSEMGLLVESHALAKAVAASIENDIAAGNSWQVILQDGRLAWITAKDGVISTETETEPMTSKTRRAEADLLMVIPDKSQL